MELVHTEQEAVNIPLETIVAMALVMRQQSKWMQIKMPNTMQEKIEKEQIRNEKSKYQPNKLVCEICDFS